MDDDEFRRRYRAGTPIAELAAAAGIGHATVYNRLRRMGEPPRRKHADTLDRDSIDTALATHWSIATAASALGVGRDALAARAEELGCLEPKESADELLALVDRIQEAIDDLRDLWWTHHSLSFGGRALGNDPPVASIVGIVMVMEEWQERLKLAAQRRSTTTHP